MYHEPTHRLVSVRDAAAALGCSVATVWRRAADGTLPPPIKIGGMTRWRMSDIEGVIDKAVAERELAA